MRTNVRTPEEEEEKKKKRRIILWLILLLLLLGLIIGGVMWLKHRPKGNYDGQAVSYNTHATRPKLKASEAAFPGFGNFTVQHPGKEFAIALANPKYNDVDLKFTVTLTQPKRQILIQTKLIAPGKAVLKIKTPNEGKRGNYPLEIKTQAFKRTKHHEALNSLDQKVTMTIR